MPVGLPRPEPNHCLDPVGWSAGAETTGLLQQRVTLGNRRAGLTRAPEPLICMLTAFPRMRSIGRTDPVVSAVNDLLFT
jgi:hypothetical protein